MKKIIKRVAVGAAVLAVLCSVPLMSGCESDHPEATITIEYDGSVYELNYRLYRNMYPQTVRHFIELADGGFYNNTIIHNYASSYLYGGGYSYNAEGYESDYETDYEEGTGAMGEYFEANSKEYEYYYDYFRAGKLTPSVYTDWSESYGYLDENALPTVIGEVGDSHVIQNGALSGGFGALRMYYSSKSSLLDASDVVYLRKDSGPDGIFEGYAKHSATSMFSIQTSTSSGSTEYCIFGQLIETEALTDLTSALSTTSTLSVSNVVIDQYDALIESSNVTTYIVTAKPIIIRSVAITKY